MITVRYWIPGPSDIPRSVFMLVCSSGRLFTWRPSPNPSTSPKTVIIQSWVGTVCQRLSSKGCTKHVQKWPPMNGGSEWIQRWIYVSNFGLLGPSVQKWHPCECVRWSKATYSQNTHHFLWTGWFALFTSYQSSGLVDEATQPARLHSEGISHNTSVGQARTYWVQPIQESWMTTECTSNHDDHRPKQEIHFFKYVTCRATLRRT